MTISPVFIVVYVFVFIYTFALFSTYSGLIFANKKPSGPDIGALPDRGLGKPRKKFF